ncbi:tyrosyl-tRNA synthetase [Candidatus Carsonella ruddii CS isolate Thao2000]|uniref:tyrosine--tRNA ligase n=1 Tax=Candidatus Carsonella ruddii CS isolate Thao2000 TaxID=1202537 RepID=J7GT96_CARRU|nr:hypothetical protein [Candidatus Carsonella ruddii]AFP83744.1 tyrosyl-tRNA synthetase [Candidatus Carsonella ruddii CS isolate Thao2000]
MIYFKNIIEKIIFKKINLKLKLIKFGIDSTYFSIHLAHLVLINFIFFLISKKFKIIIIIGDYTAKIKNEKVKKNILINSILLKSQIKNLLGNIYIFFNSIWFKKLNFNYLLNLFKFININNYIKNSFKKIILKKININEIIYPILQSIDSVLFKIEIEIGGIDQLFNIICGRFFQNFFKYKKQNGVFFKIIEINGKKISKSNNFCINFFNNKLLKIIFFNLKIYLKIKKNFFYKYLNLKKINLNKKNKIFYFKNNFFLSYFIKILFNFNKYKFNNLIYKKNFFYLNKLILKNFFIKKKKFFLYLNKKTYFFFIYD